MNEMDNKPVSVSSLPLEIRVSLLTMGLLVILILAHFPYMEVSLLRNEQMNRHINMDSIKQYQIMKHVIRDGLQKAVI